MTIGLVKRVVVIVVLLNFCLGVPSEGVNYYYIAQINALQYISNGWDIPGMTGWSTNSFPPCFAEAATDNWQGVECLRLPEGNTTTHVENGINSTSDTIVRIIGINLEEAKISGTLPVAIGDLAPFLFLILSGNPSLTGSIPRELGNLSDLITLDLHNNNFSGPIPAEISSLVNLQTMDLSNNSLNGSIPDLQDCSSLQTLDLSSNKLEGTVPFDAFQSMSNLVTLNLSNNEFSGIFPTWNSTMIKHVNLSRNAFSQSTSDFNNFISDLNNFTSFLRSYNQLVLDLSHNKIWGDVSELNFDQLMLDFQEIYLENNNISGTLNLTDSFLIFDGILNLANNGIERVTYKFDWDMSYNYTNQNLTNYANLLLNVRLDGNPFCNSTADKDSYEGFAARCFCRHDCKNYVPEKQVKNEAVKIAVAISVPSIVLVILVATFIYHRSTKQHKYNLLQMQQKFEEYDVKPTIFTYRELETATQNFHPTMKLGEGSYGAVYKGELPKPNSGIVGVNELSKSNTVAVKTVKKLDTNSERGMEEFLNEVALISGMKHRNLVKLKGCCLRDKQRLLVYEYVDNHDLEWHLFEGKSKDNLSWSQRLRICLGVAHGLHYLHSMAQPKIIHRDIKAANILLDNNFEPKIADFGLALLFPEQKSHIMTVHVAGTQGYLAPEYATLGQLSEKADVYSFGVVCLEIVSGRRNVDTNMEPEQVVLSKWALRLHREGRAIDILDSRLQNGLSENEVVEVNRVILTALLCLQYDEARRPLMEEVVGMLRGDLLTDVIVADTADVPLGFDDSRSFDEIQQPGLRTIVEEDRSLRLFQGQSSMDGSSYFRQRSSGLSMV